jgi:hypothetical protein
MLIIKVEGTRVILTQHATSITFEAHGPGNAEVLARRLRDTVMEHAPCEIRVKGA